MTVFIILDKHGEELVSTTAAERATWLMNKIPEAVRIVTDGGVLIATRQMLDARTVAEWLQKFGRYG